MVSDNQGFFPQASQQSFPPLLTLIVIILQLSYFQTFSKRTHALYFLISGEHDFPQFGLFWISSKDKLPDTRITIIRMDELKELLMWKWDTNFDKRYVLLHQTIVRTRLYFQKCRAPTVTASVEVNVWTKDICLQNSSASTSDKRVSTLVSNSPDTANTCHKNKWRGYAQKQQWIIERHQGRTGEGFKAKSRKTDRVM